MNEHNQNENFKRDIEMRDIDHSHNNLKNNFNDEEQIKVKEDNLGDIVVDDNIIEEILKDKEKHIDFLSQQADINKAIDHLNACQVYKKDLFKNSEGNYFFIKILSSVMIVLIQFLQMIWILKHLNMIFVSILRNFLKLELEYICILCI